MFLLDLYCVILIMYKFVFCFCMDVGFDVLVVLLLIVF